MISRIVSLSISSPGETAIGIAVDIKTDGVAKLTIRPSSRFHTLKLFAVKWELFSARSTSMRLLLVSLKALEPVFAYTSV